MAAGAAVGILLAPDSGKETVKKLRKGLDELGDNVKDLADQGQKALKNVRKEAAEEIEALKEGAKAKASQLKS